MIVRRGKRWVVKYWRPDSDAKTGRRMVWVGTFDTKDEARLADAQALVRQTQRPRGQKEWTIQQFYDRWLVRYHGVGTRRPESSTLVHNQAAMEAFLRSNGERRLTVFAPSEARDYAAEFPWRAKVVCAFFADAVRDGKLHETPFRGVGIRKAKGRSHIEPLTPAEVERLCAIADDVLGYYGPHFSVFIRAAAWTGMRPGELCRLTWADIDFDAGTLNIPKSKTKWPRDIALAENVATDLSKLSRMRERVFQTFEGHDMQPSSYRYYWGRVRPVFENELASDHWLSRRLREDPKDHLDVYELRHCCGSMLAVAGLSAWDISQHLGNSARVCEQIYVHPYRSVVRDRVKQAFGALSTMEFGVPSGEQEVPDAR